MSSTKSADIIIAGIGAHGSAAAWQLAKRKLKVIAFDAYQPPHTLGSSHGETRIIREVYGEHPDYVPIIQKAYEIWQELEHLNTDTVSSEPLMHITGGITIGRPESRAIKGVRKSSETHALPIEILDHQEIRRRWPQLQPRENMIGAYDHRAGALFPEQCVSAHIKQAIREGAELRFNERIMKWKPDGQGISVQTEQGDYHADQIVFAAGAWNQNFLSKLNLPLRLERQVLFWFQPASSLDLFKPEHCPNHSWEWSPGKALYCQPDYGGGVKTAFHHDGEMFDDPEQLDRTVSEADERSLRNAFADIIPQLNGRVIKSAACMYTDTPDFHFLIDRHPGHSNVIICSPCSGHGFKFSAAIGEIIADMATSREPRYDMALFNIDRLLNRDSQTQCPDD